MTVGVVPFFTYAVVSFIHVFISIEEETEVTRIVAGVYSQIEAFL